MSTSLIVTPCRDLQQALTKAQAGQLLESYVKKNNFIATLGLQVQDLQEKDQRQLSLSVGSLPELSHVAEEKVASWLKTVPASVRASLSDELLKKEWLVGNLSELLSGSPQNQQPSTPPQRERNMVAGGPDAVTPDKIRKSQAFSWLPDSPLMKRPRTSDADDGVGCHSSKYTPLSEIGRGSIPKLRYSCVAKVLMVGMRCTNCIWSHQGEIIAKDLIYPWVSRSHS